MTPAGGQEGEPLAAVLELLARVFSDPNSEVRAEAAALADSTPQLAGALRVLAAAVSLAQDVEFARLFLHGRSAVAQPYESFYRSGQLMDPECLHELDELFSAAGIAPGELDKLPPDHLAVELDLLALLLRGLASPAPGSKAEDALRALAREHLDRHLAPFITGFSARLAALNPAPYFAAAHELLVAALALVEAATPRGADGAA